MRRIMLSDNIKITSSFPAEYKIENLPEESGERCRCVEFLYDAGAEKGSERRITIEFSFPILDICGRWFPTCGFDRALKADWFPAVESMTSISAPVICFYNGNGDNRYTIALSEIKQRLTMQFGVHEEDGTMLCRTEILLPEGLFWQSYQLKIRESVKCEPYWMAISRVNDWWQRECGLEFMKVPDAARQPLYSFWYSKHQNVDAENVERESRLAAEMGFSAIIVDDGWQTDDDHRGYAFCGDWEPSVNKFPDFPAHVRTVQDMGLKYLMWFSVPYLGKHTKAWARFHDKLLCYDEFQRAGVLDLRYPQVREYLKNIYCRAISEWKIDGLKLDFIDEFYLRPESPQFCQGMDYADVQEALDVFLTDVMRTLKKLRPDILIEFRQRYVGPQIRKYGNLLRVADCPGSAISNRVGIVDLRLLSGNTAVHSDMLMWHKDEKPEDAALQVISCLFGTVQISVELENITEEMKAMLLFWTSFMREHVKLLQLAQIQPQEPENLYPQVQAEDETARIIVQYSRGRVVDICGTKKEIYYIHGTKEEEVCIRLPEQGTVHCQVMNCMGKTVLEKDWKSEKWGSLPVPTGGVVRISAAGPER